VPVDVTSEADIASMIEATTREFGRLDFAYNNAGVLEDRVAAADIPVEQWRRVLDVNLTGVWLCLRAEIPVMMENGGGVIINTASVAALYGGSAWHMAAYAASKAGVVSMSKVAARDYAMDNIRVVSICPGAIDTPMLRGTREANPEWAKEMSANKPMGRFGRPDEIAKTVVWLCSDDASYITGNAIAVDGAAYA
jgi:NAD(P)-dependent dehydrogenase (short-subunit alcohol dehydrogenase family)